MQADINDTAKVGLTILLMVSIVGIVFNVNMATQDFIRKEENSINRTISAADYESICDICDSGDDLTGAGLYSFLTEYSDRMTGVLLEKSVYQKIQGTTINPAVGSMDTSRAYVYTHKQVQNRQMQDLINIIYTYGLNHKFSVVRSVDSGMEMSRKQVFIYISECRVIGE